MKAAGKRAATPTSVVAEAFELTWLSQSAKRRWRAHGGERVSTVGPLPIAPASNYVAEYLRSIFNPGATAPLHVHSGPEAFYALGGVTCLKTPDGLQIWHGPVGSMMIKADPPMLLMAIGKVSRPGFALIFPDATQVPTTMTQAWHLTGLCARKLSADQIDTACRFTANPGYLDSATGEPCGRFLDQDA